MCTLFQRPPLPASSNLKGGSSSSASPSQSQTPKPKFFSFSAGPLPLALPLSFGLPSTTLSSPNFTFSYSSSSPTSKPADPRRAANPLKRRRRLTDVDGDLTSALLRKKRRLRLTLITSRLSRPFSSPATNIVDRGQNKAAVWARLRNSRRRGVVTVGASGRPGTPFPTTTAGTSAIGIAMPEPLLRKAAILNRLRLQGKHVLFKTNSGEVLVSDGPLKSQLKSQEPQAIASLAADEPFVETLTPETERIESPNLTAQIPVNNAPYKPMSPSPLGMSNYDALDLEDDFPEDEEYDYDASDDSVGGGRRRESFYSDFSFCDTSTSEEEEEDSFGSFRSLGST